MSLRPDRRPTRRLRAPGAGDLPAAGLVLSVLVLAGLALAACGGEPAADGADGAMAPGPAWSPAPSHWPAWGGDAGGTRHSPLDAVHRGNVDELEVAWTFRTGERGRNARDGGDLTFESTPLHFEGRLYLTTGFSEVVALDPVTGRSLWRFDPGVDRGRSYSEVTSRGVAAWRDPEAEPGAPCASRVFVGTIDGRLLALDAATGRPCRSFGDGGEVALWRLAGVEPGDRGDYQVTSAPAVVEGRVVVGSSIGDNTSVDTGDGSVRAFDARTGELEWVWNPLRVRGPGEVGAANAWSTFSVDRELGRVFVPTGSASPDFWGGFRRGEDVWASSVVALDAASGRQEWGFQTVHHDLFDYDVAAQPSLATVTRDGDSVPVVVQPTKAGFVFVLGREEGTPVFGVEERSVPESHVPGEEDWPTQPHPTAPPPLVDDRGVDPERPWGPDSAHVEACARLAEGYRYDGLFTPPSLRGSLLFPGGAGGTNWGSAAVHPARDLLVVPTNRLGTLVRLVEPDSAEAAARELRRRGAGDVEVGRQRGAPYAVVRTPWVVDGLPCTPPPFGRLTAVDLETGTVRWRVPKGGGERGSAGVGGPVVTGGGLVFVAGTADGTIRARDVETGELLWRAELPRAAMATPMTYRGADGRQYVAVAAGGHGKWGLETGDFLVAFARPR